MAPVTGGSSKGQLVHIQLRLAFLLLLLGFVSGCTRQVRDRPFGYFRLGKVSELSVPSTLLEKEGLLLRHDERGFFVMSALCTYDLSALHFEMRSGERVLVSTESGSEYSESGKVLKGPAVADLSYYKLVFDAWEYGGPKDTLYARVGEKVPSSSRLKVEAPAQ